MKNSVHADQPLHCLERDGFIEHHEGGLQTTRKWQSAMARAALRLYKRAEQSDDLRVPIAMALTELYGTTVKDEDLADYIEAILPIEAKSLGTLVQ